MKASFFLTFLLLQLAAFSQQVQVQIAIENLDSEKGSVVLKVFQSAAAYDADKPDIIKHIPKKGHMQQGVFSVKVDLPAGQCGLAFVDDANSNRQMDYNMLGMPKEGFGFANFYVKGLSRPVFSDFAFPLNEGTKQLSVRLRYM